MFTESDRTVHSRERCLDEAAEALARCYQRIEDRERATAPAEARAV